MGRTLLSYAYDLDGNKISRRDVTGKETAYTYNRDGLLTAVLEGGKTLAAYTYHADGNVERLCIGTSLTTQYDYDIDRNLQGIRTMDGTTVLTESTFSYDGNANRTEKKGLEGLTRYSYDANNRLIEVQYPHIIGSLKDGNTAFEKLSYDKAGNRIQRVTESLTEQYHYDNCNRLTRLDTTPTDLNKPQTIKCYLYDKQGNMLSDGSNTYSYDGFNRVAEVRTAEGNVQKNHYDAEGLRHEMEENGKLVKFLYNENREVEAEEEASGNIIRYVRGLGLISSDSESARTYYHYVCDEQGSVTHVLEGESGAVLNRYTYDAFGNTIDCEEQVHNRFRYNGEQYDPVTSQYYLRARFYNPAIARFTQEDTYYGDGLNLYQYCANNPVGYQDPDGHKVCPVQLELYKKYKEQGMSPKEAYNRMRQDLGLSAKNPTNVKTKKFTSWEQMKDYYSDNYNGGISKFLRDNKPKGSRNVKKWLKNGGTIEIADGNNKVWFYQSAGGDSAAYVYNHIIFSKEYFYDVAEIAEINLDSFTGNRTKDKQQVLNYLMENYDMDELPKGFALHHDYVNGRYQLIRIDIHSLFTHHGGFSKHKGGK